MIGMKIALTGLAMFVVGLFFLSMPDDLFGTASENICRFVAGITVLGVVLVVIGCLMAVWL